MKDLTLLIMAGGMGSRFGGLKQLQPVGPNKELLIDYSIYDAVKAGFNKVVFVIKKENFEEFKETVGSRVDQHIKVEYVFQELEDLPEGFTVPEGREKPWGTAHAIAAAKDVINENFAIINADDFYGRDAFMVMADFLKNEEKKDKEQYSVVGYRVANTLTEHGSVKRGVCEDKDGYLTKITESIVERTDGVIEVKPLSGADAFTVEDDCLVSMNMLGFTKEIFNYIDKKFPEFLEEGIKDLKSEFLIPEVLQMSISDNLSDVKVLETDARWYGITYREDLPGVIEAINNMINEGVYPNKLWS